MTSTLPLLALGHVGINVTDLDGAIAFYGDVLGFTVVRRSDEAGRRFAFLAQGDTLMLTLWEQSTGTFGADRPGLHHLAFRVPGIEDVAEVERRARAAGARIHHGGIVPHGEGQASGGLFFEGPDSVRLEVCAPAGADRAPAPGGAAPTCGFF